MVLNQMTVKHCLRGEMSKLQKLRDSIPEYHEFMDSSPTQEQIDDYLNKVNEIEALIIGGIEGLVTNIK